MVANNETVDVPMDMHEKGRRTGEFIAHLHDTRPLSDDPLSDALEDGARAFAALSVHAESSSEVGSLQRGIVSGITDRFGDQLSGGTL